MELLFVDFVLLDSIKGWVVKWWVRILVESYDIMCVVNFVVILCNYNIEMILVEYEKIGCSLMLNGFLLVLLKFYVYD